MEWYYWAILIVGLTFFIWDWRKLVSKRDAN
ncbi:hypothetical protein J2S11_000751 [Bacillus horti]|uniref:Uncharacterized protein n=1 Tax=Caldalkalibacillus horti TaxID=77523 RepID=A0ABT9VV39_9BACI|nr:hypothetical protein [Bacillus horti]